MSISLVCTDRSSGLLISPASDLADGDASAIRFGATPLLVDSFMAVFSWAGGDFVSFAEREGETPSRFSRASTTFSRLTSLSVWMARIRAISKWSFLFYAHYFVASASE